MANSFPDELIRELLLALLFFFIRLLPLLLLALFPPAALVAVAALLLPLFVFKPALLVAAMLPLDGFSFPGFVIAAEETFGRATCLLIFKGEVAMEPEVNPAASKFSISGRIGSCL